MGPLEFPFCLGTGDDKEYFYYHPDSDEGHKLIVQGFKLPPLSAYSFVNMLPTHLRGPAGTQRFALSPNSIPEEDATPPPPSQNVTNTVHTSDGAQVSHADIDMSLRPSKRRAENTEVGGTHKMKRRQTEDYGENAEPKIVEKGVKKRRNEKYSGHITEVAVHIY